MYTVANAQTNDSYNPTYFKRNFDKSMIFTSQTNAIKLVNGKCKIYPDANAKHHTIDGLHLLHTITPITIK